MWLAVVLVSLVSVFGCSGGSDDDELAPGGDGDGDGDSDRGNDESSDEPDAAPSDDDESSAGSAGGGAGSAGVGVSGGGGTGGGSPPGLCPNGGCTDAEIVDTCESESVATSIEHTLRSSVLFVYDRSGSMMSDWNGQTRFLSVGTAVEAAMQGATSRLTAGALFFPSTDPDAPLVCVDPTGIACMFTPGLLVPGGGCITHAIDEADQIPFTDGESFLAAFTDASSGMPRYSPIPSGQTPLFEALQAAEATLEAAGNAESATVVIITDGEPNCMWDAAGAQAIMTRLAAAGAITYVVGLPGSEAAMTVLSELAQAGSGPAVLVPGTVEVLQEQLASVLMEQTIGLESCAIELADPIDVSAELHVIVTINGDRFDVASSLGVAGWVLSSDGAELELVGELCTAAQDGQFQAIELEVGCVDLPMLPEL